MGNTDSGRAPRRRVDAAAKAEDQLCALTWDGYMGTGSPDRVGAMVWAMTELFDKERGMPSVRAL